MESRQHVVEVPKWTLGLRIASLVIAIIVLGLNAYGIRWVAFDKLIVSLVVCLCTLGVVIYMIVATLAVPKAYNMWAFLALDIWMVIFWLIQFSLVASLAAAVADLSSWTYDYVYYFYWKRDLSKRDSTTYNAYYGALVAGAVLGAFNFLLFLANLIIFSIYLHRHRLSGAPSTAPPGYSGNAAVPTEKYGSTAQPYQQQPQPMPQQPQPVAQPQYGQPQYAQPQYAQPQYTQPQYAQPQQPAAPQFTTPYTQAADPVNRREAVSPISPVGQPQNTSELSGPLHLGNPNAVELSSPQQTSNPNTAELGTAGYR